MVERILLLWVVATEKTLQLNILPQTKPKVHQLADTYSAFHTITSNTLGTIKSSKPRTYTQLHHFAYTRDRLSIIGAGASSRLETWSKRALPALGLEGNRVPAGTFQRQSRR